MIMRTIALVLAIAGGIAASQVPEFAQQYRQRLGGAVDELGRVLDSFDQDAASTGTDRAGGLALMAKNGEPLVRAQAVTVAKAIIRYDRLVKQQAAFQASLPFERLTVFFQDFDRPLVESTLRDYEPAVPTTSEGFVFAVIGFFAIYGVLGILGVIFHPRRRRHRHRHPDPAPEQTA
ncbi:MAG: DUF2937 family protein [Bauldia sp.]